MIRNKRFPLILVLTIIWLSLFHSYFVLNAKIISPLFSILIGSWKETIFLALALWFLLRQAFLRIRIKNKVLWLLTITLTVYGVWIGLANGVSVFDVIVNGRDFMLPLYFYLLISNLPSISLHSFKWIAIALLVLLTTHGIVSLYDYLTFNGMPEQIWVYKIFSNLDKGVPFGEANYIRDGKLRAMGFFVSPLEYSMTMLFGLFLLTFYFTLSRSILIKFWSIFLLAVFLLFIFVSGVRVSMICYALGVPTVVMVHKAKSLNRRIIFFYIFPVGLVLITFGNIIFNFGLNDLSSLGRLDQYTLVPLLMIQNPLGFGFGEVGSKGIYAADSSILTLLMAFGWAFISVYLFIIINIFLKLIKWMSNIRNAVSNLHVRVFAFSLIAYSVSSVYTFFFHESIFYNFQYLLFIFIGLIAGRFELDKSVLTDFDALLRIRKFAERSASESIECRG